MTRAEPETASAIPSAEAKLSALDERGALIDSSTEEERRDFREVLTSQHHQHLENLKQAFGQEKYDKWIHFVCEASMWTTLQNLTGDMSSQSRNANPLYVQRDFICLSEPNGVASRSE